MTRPHEREPVFFPRDFRFSGSSLFPYAISAGPDLTNRLTFVAGASAVKDVRVTFSDQPPEEEFDNRITSYIAEAHTDQKKRLLLLGSCAQVHASTFDPSITFHLSIAKRLAESVDDPNKQTDAGKLIALQLSAGLIKGYCTHNAVQRSARSTHHANDFITTIGDAVRRTPARIGNDRAIKSLRTGSLYHVAREIQIAPMVTTA